MSPVCDEKEWTTYVGVVFKSEICGAHRARQSTVVAFGQRETVVRSQRGGH
jgi:hypothetical protein